MNGMLSWYICSTSVYYLEDSNMLFVFPETHMIECVDYTGRGRRIVYEEAGWAFDLVYANNVFYWTDWDQ